jgi:hypothetical protein
MASEAILAPLEGRWNRQSLPGPRRPAHQVLVCSPKRPPALRGDRPTYHGKRGPVSRRMSAWQRGGTPSVVQGRCQPSEDLVCSQPRRQRQPRGPPAPAGPPSFHNSGSGGGASFPPGRCAIPDSQRIFRRRANRREPPTVECKGTTLTPSLHAAPGALPVCRRDSTLRMRRFPTPPWGNWLPGCNPHAGAPPAVLSLPVGYACDWRKAHNTVRRM